MERVVKPEGFKYYVDRSSARDKGDDSLFMKDLDYESRMKKLSFLLSSLDVLGKDKAWNRPALRM